MNNKGWLSTCSNKPSVTSELWWWHTQSGHTRCTLMQAQWVWVCCGNTTHKPSHTIHSPPGHGACHTSTQAHHSSDGVHGHCWHHTSCVTLWMAHTSPSSVTIMHCTCQVQAHTPSPLMQCWWWETSGCDCDVVCGKHYINIADPLSHVV